MRTFFVVVVCHVVLGPAAMFLVNAIAASPRFPWVPHWWVRETTEAVPYAQAALLGIACITSASPWTWQRCGLVALGIVYLAALFYETFLLAILLLSVFVPLGIVGGGLLFRRFWTLTCNPETPSSPTQYSILQVLTFMGCAAGVMLAARVTQSLCRHHLSLAYEAYWSSTILSWLHAGSVTFTTVAMALVAVWACFREQGLLLRLLLALAAAGGLGGLLAFSTYPFEVGYIVYPIQAIIQACIILATLCVFRVQGYRLRRIGAAEC